MRIHPAVLCCAVLAGCSHGTGSTPPVPAAVISNGTAADAVVVQPASLVPAFTNFHYSFKGAPHDGSTPLDSMIAVSGALYGTTNSGGSHSYGTAYKINLSAGTETILHNFGSGSDGQFVQGRLLNVSGTFYGTTTGGGTHGDGTVFKLTPSGASYTETVLYSFKGGSDGEEPIGGLIDVGGKLYGSTGIGGTEGLGTLFEVSTTGSESVVHSFGTYDSSGALDGYGPRANLTELDGTLYGTTGQGGSHGDGTVFSFNPNTHAELVLHSFSDSSGDGSSPGPFAGPIAVNGTLYGTTSNGGSAGNGTVFSLKPGSSLKTIYSFAGGSDGVGPDATLIYTNGLLYGTTDSGGTGGNGGDGTVFKISTSGSGKVVLHRFVGGTDGSLPQAGVIELNSAIFGTTENGGSGGQYDGTVYKLPL